MDNIICIAGPTASGKTELAVALAKEINAEIISCDSMQVYRDMDIGTAKPTIEEMQGIPHHMLSVAEPTEDFSVSRYCELATPILEDILARGKTAIVVGGTGLYMDALIKGNQFAPSPSTGMREKLELQADTEGMPYMLELLRSIDPDAAAKLHLKDRKRILRALEVYYETGETITAHNEKTQTIPPKYNPYWFALTFSDRSALYDRIDRRVAKMLEAGLLGEIKALLDAGVPEKCTAMQAIGYKEFVDALAGRVSIEKAADQVRQSSRHYAKRQLTWFRRNPAISWLQRTPEDNVNKILISLRQTLADFDK